MTMDKKLQDVFGFVDGVTTCSDCGGLLNRENSWWAFGTWWHIKVADCDRIKSLKEG